MLLGIYADPHITKNMKSIQGYWESSVQKTFCFMYEQFNKANVEMAVCLGDFFDKAVLEAKSVRLVTEILQLINSQSFPTIFLLGNHEVDSYYHNILEFLDQYENIIPVTERRLIDNNMYFIPYTSDIEDFEGTDCLKDKIVFTHHDFYGTELANGKVKASFGIDPNLVKDARIVFNGHVHLHSELGNIVNLGSVLKSQQGELKVGDYPCFATYNTVTGDYNYIPNFYSIMYLTVGTDVRKVIEMYEPMCEFILSICYTDDEDFMEDPDQFQNIIKYNLRKRVSGSLEDEIEVSRTHIDIKEVVSQYIMNDSSIADSDKEVMINLGLTLLGD